MSSIDAKLKEKNSVKESLDAKISEMQETLSSLKKQEKEISDRIKKNSERIEKSDRFWSTVKDMAFDPTSIEEFMKNAKSLCYDYKKIPSIEEIEKYGLIWPFPPMKCVP